MSAYVGACDAMPMPPIGASPVPISATSGHIVMRDKAKKWSTLLSNI